MREMCQAAKAIGNTELENKFAKGRRCFFLSAFCLRKEMDAIRSRTAASTLSFFDP